MRGLVSTMRPHLAVLRLTVAAPLGAQQSRAERIAGGGIFGFTSHLAWLPDDSLTVAVLFNTAGQAAPDDLTEAIVAAVAGRKVPAAVPYAGDLAELAGQYRGVGRGRAQALSFAVADGLLTVAGSAQPQPLIYLGDGVFGRRSARYQFIRSNGKVTAVRADLVAGNTVLARQKGLSALPAQAGATNRHRPTS